MKTLFIALIISLLMVSFPQSARADYEDGDRVPNEIIQPLMAWVEMQTGVRVPALPRVVTSKTRLTNIVSHMGRIAGRARAVYVRGAVILDDRYFDDEDATQLSLLVHELVHYAQSFKHQSNWACAQSKEVEAYTLQNQWLEMQGHAPFVRASWISRMAACPNVDTRMAVADAR